MLTTTRSRTGNRRGAVTVTMALCLIILMTCAALSVDLGRMHQEKTRLQVAADAAADAAGLDLYNNYKTLKGVDRNGTARAAALEMAKANGYGAANITINIPPKDGPNQGKAGYAEIITFSELPSTFSAVMGLRGLKTSARAVGAGAAISTKAGLLVLEDKKKKSSLSVKGNSSSLNVEGDIFVNSPSKKSVKVGKKGEIVADHLITAGGIDRKSKGLIDADVTTGASTTPDPLDGVIPIPEKGPKRDLKELKTTSGSQDVYNLLPGTYSELKFDKNAIINMAPGEYYVDGGAMEFRDTAVLNAKGVMIYSNSKKTIKFKSKGKITLTPPTSGSYAGISIFQNPSKKSKLQFSKEGAYNITGIIYAPKSEIKFSKADVEFGDPKDDEDWDSVDPLFDEEDLQDNSVDGAFSSTVEIGMSVIARRVSVGKNSNIKLKGRDIGLTRPLKGLVE